MIINSTERPKTLGCGIKWSQHPVPQWHSSPNCVRLHRRRSSANVLLLYTSSRTEDLPYNLRDARFFIALDRNRGFWLIPFAEDRAKTALSSHEGAFEWKRMPFDMCNAPSRERSPASRGDRVSCILKRHHLFFAFQGALGPRFLRAPRIAGSQTVPKAPQAQLLLADSELLSHAIVQVD